MQPRVGQVPSRWKDCAWDKLAAAASNAAVEARKSTMMDKCVRAKERMGETQRNLDGIRKRESTKELLYLAKLLSMPAYVALAGPGAPWTRQNL